MQSVTSAFLSEVTGSHTAISRAELWVSGSFVRYLYPTDGSVEIDARRAVRRSATIHLVDEDGTLNPNSSASLLTPYGSEVVLYRGVQYVGGSTEYAPLGVFRIVNVTVTYGANGVELDVQLEDRSRVVQVQRYSSPYTVAAGTAFDVAIATLVSSRYSSATLDTATTTYSTPTSGAKVLGLEATDPWSDVVGMAEAIGQEAYFGADGTFLTRPIPTLTGSAVLTFAEGAGGTLLNIQNAVGTADVYNGIIAKAEGSQLLGPLESRVWDDDASSPTRRTGPLGERPYEWSSSWVGSQAQLDDVAAALLDTVRGIEVTFDAIPNPALDVRDIVQVTSPTIGLSSVAMVDTIRMPLSPSEPMTVTARLRGY